jgi:hypothetical protein
MELFPADMTPITSPPVRHTCPVCSRSPLAQVAECSFVHFLCPSCGHCWQDVHGHLRSVDPIRCPGCATKPRAECVELFGREFPQFGADNV